MTMTNMTTGQGRAAPTPESIDIAGPMDLHLQAAMLGQPDAIRATLIPIASGGKRLRARMARMATQLGPTVPDPDQVEALTASIELLHLATLVHDDIIDGDLERRGHPSLFAAFDEGTSIVAGDRIIGNAFELAAQVSAQCAGGMAQCLMSLCDGQQHEELCVHDGTWTAADYWRSVDGKTASLFVFALVAGGELAEAGPTTLDTLRDFGMSFGRGYQLLDDLIDLPSTPPGRQLVRALSSTEATEPFGFGAELPGLVDLATGLFTDAIEAATSLSTESAVELVELARTGYERTIRLIDDVEPGTA